MSIINSANRSRAHITSGLVLAAFVATHFANHALGLVSVGTMEATRHVFNIVWRSWPGTILLYGALLAHFLLALHALYRRRSLRMPVNEAVKVVFGLSLPFLLIFHVVGTRVVFTLSGHDKGYPEVLRAIWSSPLLITVQSAALVVAWTHGCLGIWFWLRGREWFQRSAPFFHMIAIVVPLLAVLGVFSSARVVAHMAPAHGQPVAVSANPHQLMAIQLALYSIFSGLIGGTLLLKTLPRKGSVRVRYPGGKVVTVGPGFSVLEASRSAGIPHVSVCGGRGRCSTCRVQILQGGENLPPPGERERSTLTSIGAPADVRLACQLRPRHDLTVLPLVDAESLPQVDRLEPGTAAGAGRERMVVALFCDIRGFTELSEQKLPYDVVFLLNHYFAMVGEAVEGAGGVVDKFIGDGAIALFGLDTAFDQACRQALAAAVRIAKGIDTINQSFSTELDAPLRIAMGLHGGPVVIGRMGYGRASALTAIGDTINTTSRLEGLAKQHDVELAVSDDVVREASLSFSGLDRQELTIRGRTATLETWIIPNAAEIDRFLNPQTAPDPVQA